MRKNGIFHPDVLRVLATLGHADAIVIADAGLPIPAGPTRIDLGFTEGVPSFLSVLQAVCREMEVETALLAEEMRSQSPSLYGEVENELHGTTLKTIPHEMFKIRTRQTRAIIRTGEFTPYANVILHAGVVF